MTSPRNFHWHRVILLCLASTGISAVGCSTFKLPDLAFGTKSGAPDYRGPDGSRFTHPVTEQIYHSTRQALAENGIVLNVVDDEDSPVRVLPLPPGERTVYVSDLLTQTGVQHKLGSIEATLYRHTSDTIGGIPLDVKTTPDGRQVRPESDYALQAGDRLQVQKKKTPPPLEQIVNTVLGI